MFQVLVVTGRDEMTGVRTGRWMGGALLRVKKKIEPVLTSHGQDLFAFLPWTRDNYLAIISAKLSGRMKQIHSETSRGSDELPVGKVIARSACCEG